MLLCRLGEPKGLGGPKEAAPREGGVEQREVGGFPSQASQQKALLTDFCTQKSVTAWKTSHLFQSGCLDMAKPCASPTCKNKRDFQGMQMPLLRGLLQQFITNSNKT